jgi:hypothetical protein
LAHERQSSRSELVLEALDVNRLKQPGPEDPMNLNRGRQYEAGELVEGIVVEQHAGTPERALHRSALLGNLPIRLAEYAKAAGPGAL